MKLPTVCKKVSDPPEETKGEWRETECRICNVKIRATVAVSETIKYHGHISFPICFDCAMLGPEVVSDWMDILP